MQANIKHVIYRAHSLDKDEVIARILQAEGRGKTVIFTRTKRAAARIVEELKDRGFNAAAVHGDLNQEQRERAMAAFKAGKRDVLIATDVAARGIDVDDVTHVINHTIPDDPDTYLHRAGRTGRAGKTGIAVTFVDWDDLHKWTLIDKALEFGIPEPVETYSSSPHLFADLDIPAGTKGRLPGTSPRAATAGAEKSGGEKSGPPSRSGSTGTGASRSRSRSRSGGSDQSASRRTSGDRPAPERTAPADDVVTPTDDVAPTSGPTSGEDSTDGAAKRRRRRRRRGGSASSEATASAPQGSSDGE
jgi:superfamily II DNA/RNA helicase